MTTRACAAGWSASSSSGAGCSTTAPARSGGSSGSGRRPRWSSTGRPRRSSASSPTAALLEPGAEVAVGGWGKPTAEPEIAVHVGRRRPARRRPRRGRGRDRRPRRRDRAGRHRRRRGRGDPRRRHLPPPRPARAGVAAGRRRTGCAGEIAHGDELIDVDDPWALVGDPVAALAHLATHLARVRRDRPGRRGPDHRLDRPRARRGAGRPDRLPARAARRAGRWPSRTSGGPARRGYTPRALAPMAELVDAPG